MTRCRRLKVESLEDRHMLATFVVVNLFDGPVTGGGQLPGSLRQAIFDANASPGADHIEFSFLSGIIPLTQGELLITDHLSIDGPVTGEIILDASSSDPTPSINSGDGSRLFNIDDTTSTARTVSIRNLILTGGDVSGDGGAIRNTEELSLTNIVTHNNTATGYGGGIFSNTSLTLTASTVASNTATNRGGGIATIGGSFTIINSTLSGNDAFGGGGFHSQNTYVQVNGSTITGNTAYTGGGGIRNYLGSLTVKNSTIDNNTGGYGGGIRNNQSHLTITNSSVSGNTGTQAFGNNRGGGGIFQFLGDLTVTDCKVSGNTSKLKGGGIYASRSLLNITASQLNNNYSKSHGGGLYSNQTNIEISTTTISGNIALGRGGGIIRAQEYDLGPLVIKKSTISNNQAELEGGGIFSSNQEITESYIISNTAIQNGGGLQGAQISLVDSIVDGNQTGGNGGGIWSKNLTISGSTISRNIAVKGGGIFNAQGTMSISESLLSENIGYLQGGAIHFRDSEVTIRHSTISDNSSAGNHPYSVGSGGGIYGQGVCTITGSQISGNLATAEGGGIFLYDQMLTILDSLVSNNYSGADGGGIFCRGRELIIAGTTFRNNHAQSYGGALSGFGLGSLTISSSAFLVNRSGDRGGGIFVGAYEVKISSSDISGNQAQAAGGGIYVDTQSLTLTASSVTGNSSFSNGGGMSARFSSSFTVTSSTFGGNSAHGNGAGLYLWSQTPMLPITIRHSTIARNTSDQAGGGLFVAATGAVELNHTIVAQNQAAFGSDLIGLIGVIFDAESSLIGSNAGSGISEAPVGMPDAKNNLIGGSIYGLIDPLLGPLSHNGGTGATYELLVGSPALNAGDPEFTSPPDYDQRGVGFDRVSNGRIDMGAYEVQAFAGLPGDFNGDGVVTGSDFLAWQRGESPDPFSGDDLKTWQEEYGGGSLSALSASVEDEVVEDDQDASVSLMFGNSYVSPAAPPTTPPTADSSLFGGSPRGFELGDFFVESVDLAIEELSAVTHYGVREFGDFVARRSIKSKIFAR